MQLGDGGDAGAHIELSAAVGGGRGPEADLATPSNRTTGLPSQSMKEGVGIGSLTW